MRSKDTPNQLFEAAWKDFRQLPQSPPQSPQSPSLLLAQLVMATVARKSPNIGRIFLEAALSGMLGEDLQKSVEQKRRDATTTKTQLGKLINPTKAEQEILNRISDGTLHLSGIGFKTKDGATQHLLPPEYATFLLKILWESTINNPQRKSLVNAIREVVEDIETLPPEKKNDYTETIRRNLTLPYINSLALLILIQQNDGLFCYLNAAGKPKKKYPWQSPIGHPDILGWEVIENTTGMLLRYNGPEAHRVPVPVWNKLISQETQWPEALRLRPLEPGTVFAIGGDLRKLLEGYRGLDVRVKGDPIYAQLLKEYPDNIPKHLRLEAFDTSPLLSASTRHPLPAGTRVDDNGFIIVPTSERDPYEDVFLPSEELLQKFIEGTVRALREQQDNPSGDSKKIQDFFDRLSNLSLFSNTENNAFDKETARYWIAIALRSLQDDNVAYSVENPAITCGLLSHHSTFADKIFEKRGFYLAATTNNTLLLKDLGDTSFFMPWGAQYGSRVMIEIPREVLSSLIDLNSILIPDHDHDPNINFLNMLNQTRRE